MWCWGANFTGQLGNGTTGGEMCWGDQPCERTPAKVPLSGVAEVETGTERTCARTQAGAVHCWGDNTAGQLGDGTEDGDACWTANKCRASPQLVPALASGVTQISLGVFSCALKGGGVWCWGGKVHINTGYGSTPVAIPGLSGVTKISVSTQWQADGFACALKSDGTAWCWGENGVGQLGDGTTGDSQAPVQVALDDSETVVDISVGVDHACAVRSDGSVWCWGANDYGQLGNGTTAPSIPIPEKIGGAGLQNDDIEAGTHNTCVTKKDGSTLCWGRGSDGELGIGSPNSPLSPTEASALDGFFGLDVGRMHSCAIKSVDGTLWCWGQDAHGELGDGDASMFVDDCAQTPAFCSHLPAATLVPCP